MNITYLGPAGATFTAIAYDRLARLFAAPLSNHSGVDLSVAKANEEVLPLILSHGGYGALAMETRAEGRVDSPVNSFIELLRRFNMNCPIQVIGALSMRIHFMLMAQSGVMIEDVKKVIAHPKAIGACRDNLRKLGVEIVESSSNGQAAADTSVATDRGIAALGPLQAAQKYDLNILNDSFEDREASTTFFLLGPQEHEIKLSPSQRSLTVFRVKNVPGAVVDALIPFKDEGINLRLIHTLHFENGVYDCAIEAESNTLTLSAHKRAMLRLREYTERWIQFGPFPFISD